MPASHSRDDPRPSLAKAGGQYKISVRPNRMINSADPRCYFFLGREEMKTKVNLLLLLLVTAECTGTHRVADGVAAQADIMGMEHSGQDPSCRVDATETEDAQSDALPRPDIDPASIITGISCIDIQPPKVNFGGTKVGELTVLPVKVLACGQSPLRIDAIYLEQWSSPAFAVHMPTLDFPPTTDNPLVLLPGESLIVDVHFLMESFSSVDDEGNLIVETGEVIIENTSNDQFKDVPVMGSAPEKAQCPTAIIKCKEGNEVAEGTLLNLFGDESYASDGGVVKWKWEVDEPYWLLGDFVPASTFPNPTFHTYWAALYTFHLTVWDQNGQPSCQPAQHQVLVVEIVAIKVELTWTVPGGNLGIPLREQANLDLHLTHPWAFGPDVDGDGQPDGWYDLPFDCWTDNKHPNWGSYDPAANDDPTHSEDDAGETITFDIPENVTYKVGVHSPGYWQNEVAEAVVRVYIQNELLLETAPVSLNPLDMWEVLTIEWPTGEIQTTEDSDGKWKITPDYSSLYFY